MPLQFARPIIELGEVSQFRVGVYLETPAVRVQNEGGTVVGVDIADADALPVAREVRTARCLVAEHLGAARRSRCALKAKRIGFSQS